MGIISSIANKIASKAQKTKTNANTSANTNTANHSNGSVEKSSKSSGAHKSAGTAQAIETLQKNSESLDIINDVKNKSDKEFYLTNYGIVIPYNDYDSVILKTKNNTRYFAFYKKVRYNKRSST